ncbi:MAG: diacylglycerol kinase family protein [Bacteroidota bacterium]
MGWRKRVLSFKYAFQGIKILYQTQPNFIIHSVLGSLAILLAILLKLSYFEWLVLIVTITLVLFAEAINSALEFLTDLISPDLHPLAGKAKDVAAAAVLITAIGAVVVGLFLFLPKLLDVVKTLYTR